MKRELSFVYSIRRSQRAKKTRIIVTAEKIEVVAPLKVSERKIHAFVRSQQEWVVSAADKVEKKRQAIKKQGPGNYVNGVSIPYKGQETRIWLKPIESNKLSIEFNEQGINIYLACHLQEDSDFIKQALIDWLRKQALKSVDKYVELHSSTNNLLPRFIRVKSQKSRWGSCGIHNDININWLLVLAPPEVMEYVVVHELCHIKQRNHSARFWHLVEECLPGYQQQRNWLKRNGSSLMQGL